MDEKLLEVYIEKLNDNLKELKDGQKVGIDIAQGLIIQLKMIELRLSSLEDDKKDGDFWQKVVLWIIALSGFALGAFDKIPGAGG